MSSPSRTTVPKKNRKLGLNANNSEFYRLTDPEAEVVRKVYRMYDTDSKGFISNYLATKLMKQLGFKVDTLVVFADTVTLKDILNLLDRLLPDPDPQKILEGSLSSFVGLACRDSDYGEVLFAEDISNFMESLGRPPASLGESSLLLNSMLDYDDCSTVPSLKAEIFARDVIYFAKKNNVMKDYK